MKIEKVFLYFTLFLMLDLCTYAKLLEAQESKSKTPLTVTPKLLADESIMKIIDSLGDNSSANLPHIKLAGDMKNVSGYGMSKHGPGGRNFCKKMVWMPDRKRAIYCGAGHETKRLNDVWEYDLPSNTWVCLYASDLEKKRANKDIKYWADVELKDGVLRTKRGGPAIIGHQWWQVTYDPTLKAMLFMSKWKMFPSEITKKYIKSGKHKHSPPLWAFYPEEKKWSPILNQNSKQKSTSATCFDYISDLNGSIYYAFTPGRRVKGTFFYDSAKNTWKDLKAGGMTGGNCPTAEAVTGYIPAAKILVGWSGTSPKRGNKEGRIAEYDIVKNTWKKIIEGKDVPVGHDAGSIFGCDTTNQVCLLLKKAVIESGHIWVYDVKIKKLKKLKINGPPPPPNKFSPAYYDPARNVLVVYHKGKVWVYRYKKRGTSK